MSPEINNIIIEELKKDNSVTLNELKRNLQDKGINISRTTLYNRLKENGLIFKNPVYKPAISENNKVIRINWAKNHMETNWKQIIFTDETSIQLYKNSRGRWMFEYEKNYVNIFKHPLKRHVWGSISYNGIEKIYIFSDNMTKETYLYILNSVVKKDIKKSKFIYQDDNDPKHLANIVKEWFVKNNIPHLDWPPSSADLNPIENVWKLLK